MTVAIRPVRPDDAASRNACLDVVARERRYIAFLEAPPVPESAKFIAHLMAHRWPLFVAESAGQIVGWCDITGMTWPGSEHCGVLGMGLLPAWRGQGLGRRLAEAALAQAETVGLERVQLEVFADNIRAIALYEKLGFAHEGKRHRGRKLDGVYTDILMMARITPPK